VLAACRDRVNTLIVSVATIWDIQTKMEAERRKTVQTQSYHSTFRVSSDVALQHLLTPTYISAPQPSQSPTPAIRPAPRG
jgi:PIN domain nuclease of toxin-antitoxin system